ncbi:uracil-DNA glycosylase [Clostridiales Family XIII bacterium PM5-7]
MVNIGNSWDQILAGEFEQEYYQQLRQFLIREYQTQTVYPDMYDIFNALKYTAYEQVKVVILGQDPYHQPRQAHGLAFSVQHGIKPPPSLVNIYKELQGDLGIASPTHGCLQKWAEEGVLLLNTCLTVRENQANSHRGKGWEIFTDKVIELLNARKEPMVFILWGANARAKKKIITSAQHMVLESVHPSPLSAYNGFFGGKYFSKANGFLVGNGMKPIEWQL